MEQLQVATTGGWSCPHWTHHTLNLFAINFIPLAWKAWHIDGRGDTDYASRLREIGDMTQFGLFLFVLGTVLNGMLCVERRFDWLDQNPGKAARSRSRSQSPSRSRPRSCSPAETKRKSSPESPRIRRSTSMPRLEE